MSEEKKGENRTGRPDLSLVKNTDDAFRQFLIARTEQMWRLMDDPRRDINKECGYPEFPTVFMYRQWYDREGIATRVVNVYPDECWSSYPVLYQNKKLEDTPFEKAWQKLLDTPHLSPWHYLHRADSLSGIGAFGIVIIGIDDGMDLAEPVAGINDYGDRVGDKEYNLLYLRVFDQTLVTVNAYETDPNNPRFGQPLIYQVKFTDPLLLAASVQPSMMDYTIRMVHWTRVVHVADNRMSSEVFGVPRMQPVLNRLFDLRKTLAGAGEMFWRGAMPGWAFESPPELGTEVQFDDQALRDQFEAWQNGMQRYIALTGMRARSLAPQVSPPTSHVEEQMRAICSTIKVPLRIFQGSEAGHLASTQDAETWNRRLHMRQITYVTPHIICPFVDRLMKLGILPTVKKFGVEWDDLNALSDQTKADIALKRSQAIFQYVSGKCETVIPLKEYLILILGMSPEEASVVAEAAAGNTNMLTQKAWGLDTGSGPQGGARTGNAPDSNPGRPPKKAGD